MAWPWVLGPSGRVVGLGRRHRSSDDADLRVAIATGLGGMFAADRVAVLNNANCSAVGLAFERARIGSMEEARALSPRGPSEEPRMIGALVAVRLSEGVGAGVVECAGRTPRRSAFLGARLTTGAHGFAGEIGHIPIHRSILTDIWGGDPWSSTCSCGRIATQAQAPHLEQVAGAPAIRQRMQLKRGASLHELLHGARRDSRVVSDLGRVYELLGTALKGPVAMLDPKWLVITGPLAFEPALPRLLAAGEYWSHAVADLRVDVSGVNATWDTVRGAALLPLRSRVHRAFFETQEFGAVGAAPPPLEVSSEDLRARH